MCVYVRGGWVRVYRRRSALMDFMNCTAREG